MIKRFFSIATFTVLALAPYIARADITSNLVAWYRLENGASTADSSGNNNSLTFTGSPSSTSGKIGGGLNLDGTDDRGQSNAANYSALTFSAWIKLDAYPSNGGMILSECNSFQPVSEWSPTLGIDSSGHVVGYAYDFAGRYTTGTTALTTGTWYHVAMTIANSGSMIVYVNGVAEGTPASVNTMFTSWQSGPIWRIGGTTLTGSGVFSTFLDGQVDDLRIYSRALTAADVLELNHWRGVVQPLASTTPAIHPIDHAGGSIPGVP